MEDTGARPLEGDIIEHVPTPRPAADGGIVPAAATTTGQFLDLLEDGQFSADVHAQLRDLAADMQDQARATGQKVKGKVVLTIDLTFEDRAFKIASEVKVVKPKLPRPRSIMWTDEHNRFTRFPPGQAQMFGVRGVPSNSGPLRQV